MSNLRSRRIREINEQLDRKAGKQKTPAPKDVGGKKKDWDWFENKLGSNVLTGLLIIAGIIIFIFGIYSPSWKNPSLVDVVNQSRNNWFWVLLFAGIIALLIARIAGGATKTLQWCLAGGLLFIFIVLPVWFWMVGTGTSNAPQPSSHSEVPLTSAPVSTWPRITLQPGGKSENIPVPVGMHVVMNGSDFRFHCVYQDKHEESFGKGEASCSDGNMPFVYATNGRTKEMNVVSYAYEAKK